MLFLLDLSSRTLAYVRNALLFVLSLRGSYLGMTAPVILGCLISDPSLSPGSSSVHYSDVRVHSGDVRFRFFLLLSHP